MTSLRWNPPQPPRSLGPRRTALLLMAALLSTHARAPQAGDSAPPVSPSGTPGLLPPATDRPLAFAYTASNSERWPASAIADQDPGTSYSSKPFPSEANTRGTYVAAWMTARAAASSPVGAVKLTARRVNGVPSAFPRRYRIYLSNPSNTAWLDTGEHSVQPDADGVALVALPRAYPTLAIQLRPTVLGQDETGAYAFQLAELELLPPLSRSDDREWADDAATLRAEHSPPLARLEPAQAPSRPNPARAARRARGALRPGARSHGEPSR